MKLKLSFLYTKNGVHIGVLLLVLLNFTAQCVCGTNVLAVLPSVWKSHYIFGRRVLQQLVESKQNFSVTIISPHAAEEGTVELPNIREIRIDGLMENWLEMGMSFNAEAMRAQSVMERFTRLIYAGTTNVDLLLSDAQVRKLLTSGERFDLLVVDLFLSDALLGFSCYYDIPTVAISPTGPNSWLNYILGNPHNSALDPSNFLPFTERMNIWQRSINTLMMLFERMTYNFFQLISQQSVYYKHFESLLQMYDAERTLPHYRDLTKNLSLALINSYPGLQYPRAYLPNIQEIGGAHLHDKTELKLPNHLRKFIESAPHGVVYVSLGADVHFVDLPREKLESFFDVFTQLEDLRFLLKWESLLVEPELPKNIMTNSWFPQEAILAHANVKVFISSCGLLSTYEAIAGHTPILAIPILPEQEVTAKRLTQNGAALTLSYDAITYDKLIHGIRQLAYNESYAQEMARLDNLLLKTNISTSIARAAHYIDLTLDTGGLDYLKSHANSYNFWRTELIDVLVILGLGIGCILAVPFFVICCILRKSYYCQVAASHNQSVKPTNFRVTLKATGRGNSFTHGQHIACDELPSGAGGEPLRRTRSAYTLSAAAAAGADRNSTSSSTSSSSTTSTSLTSFDLTPTPPKCTQSMTPPIQLYVNHACFTETAVTASHAGD